MRLMSYKRRVARLERAMGVVIAPDEDQIVVFHIVYEDGSPGYRIHHRHWGKPNMTREYIDDRTGNVSDTPPELPCYDLPDRTVPIEADTVRPT